MERVRLTVLVTERRTDSDLDLVVTVAVTSCDDVTDADVVVLIVVVGLIDAVRGAEGVALDDALEVMITVTVGDGENDGSLVSVLECVTDGVRGRLRDALGSIVYDLELDRDVS